MVTAIIPTLNEELRIGSIIDFLKQSKEISEIIVIDDGSTDDTFAIAKRHGAKVFLSSMLGKGASMADGLGRATNENVLFLDGDIYGFDVNLVEKMISPLIYNSADFVKGKFKRKAGRVTELTAKPLLKAFFPELAVFNQPLGGIIAGSKEFLNKIKFENDYGVDVGLLIDVNQLGARIIEADIGTIEHDHQSLEALTKMSSQVVTAILLRAARYKRLKPLSLNEAVEKERTDEIKYESIISKIDFRKKIALFDMDGTLIEGSFVEHVAKFTDRQHELHKYLGRHDLDSVYRTNMIAKILEGIPKKIFEKIAKTVPLKPHAQDTIVELRKRGFQVGIITDSYFIASELIKKRVFADFSIAHHLHFHKGFATGDLTISPFMVVEGGCSEHLICKSNFINRLKKNTAGLVPDILSVGNGQNDICLFQSSNNSLAVFPTSEMVAAAAHNSIDALSDCLKYA